MQEKYLPRAINLLLDWMKKNKIKKTDLANELECTWSTLWTWTTGRKVPRIETTAKIEKLTKGKVKCTDWAIPSKEDKKNTKHKRKEAPQSLKKASKKKQQGK
jgi:hypothetical protein